MIRHTIKTVSIAAMMMSALLMAQNKIGFVQSDRIRAEYEEFNELSPDKANQNHKHNSKQIE